MNEETSATGATTGTRAERKILIKKLYMKDCSFEAPNTPAVYDKQYQPEINLNLQTKSVDLGNDEREVVLSVTAEAKLDEQTAFIVEIHQAGVFLIQGFNADEISQIIGAYCPNLLFPFAREAITDLVGKGGFPGLLLQPVNFDALYMQQMQERANATAEVPDADKH